ncbi:MAG: YjgP/YjgQ family permease, partial [Armatimonadetes bacterium CG07_land_8_20_14_0_80_40_9]
MKILDRYLVKGLIGYFLAVILGFSFIMAANQLFFSTNLFIYKGTPLAVVLKWLILKLPAILVLAFPVS